MNRASLIAVLLAVLGAAQVSAAELSASEAGALIGGLLDDAGRVPDGAMRGAATMPVPPRRRVLAQLGLGALAGAAGGTGALLLTTRVTGIRHGFMPSLAADVGFALAGGAGIWLVGEVAGGGGGIGQAVGGAALGLFVGTLAPTVVGAAFNQTSAGAYTGSLLGPALALAGGLWAYDISNRAEQAWRRPWARTLGRFGPLLNLRRGVMGVQVAGPF